VTEQLVTVVSFMVLGRARPQGSKKGMISHGRVVMVEASRGLPAWRVQVAAAAQIAATSCSWVPSISPHSITMIFEFARPAGHLRSNGEVRPTAPAFPLTRSVGDFDKLCRAISDAITGPVLVDDSHVVHCIIHKRFGPVDKTTVHVSRSPAQAISTFRGP